MSKSRKSESKKLNYYTLGRRDRHNQSEWFSFWARTKGEAVNMLVEKTIKGKQPRRWLSIWDFDGNQLVDLTKFWL